MKKNVASNDFWQSTRKGWAVLLLVLIGSFCSANLMAQNVTVKGSVKSPSDEPIPGAAVLVKGTTNGTATDISGNFSLSNVPSNATLVFSFIGMETQEINVAGKNQLDVIMKDDVISLNEVVAIGYGTVKKKDLTGALSSLGGEKLTSRQNNQVVTAMQGAMSGVTVTRASSAPGASGTIRVRGITSIQESDPLIIIDGVPASSIDNVNPADVENITVLKDAASASIYGARAAAGVILVTTKRGQTKGSSVDYNYSLSMDYPTKMPEYADAVTYMKVFNEREWNDNTAGGEYSKYDEEYINNYWALNKQNPDLYPNTDWVDLCLKNNGLRNSHQLGISTGTEKSKTKISLGYDDVQGLYVANNSWNRTTVRLSNDLKIYKWLSTSVDLNLRMAEDIVPAFSPSSTMRYAAPIYAGVYSDGRLAGGKDGANPYGKLLNGGQDKTTNYKAGGKFSVDIKPLKDLTITGIFAPNYSFTKEKDFNKAATYYTAWDDLLTTDYFDGANTTDLVETRTDNYSINSQVYANYLTSFGNHNFNVMGGFESFHYFYEGITASREQFEFTYYPYLSAGPKTYIGNSSTVYEYAYNSYFGRLMYNYKSRYYLQANFREDASSRFAKNYRWSFFPSASAGWVLTQEDFMQDLSWLSMCKIRASWGQLGNERIGNYPYESTYSFYNPTLYKGSTVTSVQGASIDKLAIEDVSWETTETYDLGLDLSFLNGRLNFTGDYYKKTTKGMLLNLKIPDYMGYAEDPDQNAGVMSTKGWDLELGWNDKIGELHYGLTFNLSDYKSIMGEMKDTKVLGDGLVTCEGSEYKEWYGYISEGIYQTADDITGTAVTSNSVQAGDIKYKDISGPDGVPDGIISATYDRVLLGGSLPRFNYGGNINLEYKGFDFLLAFQGVGKRNAMITQEMVDPIRADWYNVPQIIVGKYWSKYNTAEENLAAQYPRVSKTGESNNYAVSDFWMIDGSYFRLKNMTLGYSLSDKILDKLKIQKLRFYVSLQDFYTYSHFPTGWDPEVSSTGYPITKSVIFGASIKF